MPFYKPEDLKGAHMGSTFVQWKGTDVCMDVVCPKCDEQGHIDGDFVYALRCAGCGTIWEVVGTVPLREVQGEWKGCEPWPIREDDEETVIEEHERNWRQRLENTRRHLEEMDAPRPQRPPLDTQQGWIWFPGSTI